MIDAKEQEEVANQGNRVVRWDKSIVTFSVIQ